ncbi:hypothetical protein [Leadbettera azotonutricia]|uniref:Uncharacterized protein n=1 Tax=Leadbettera azotonutricia (strain ATCC BAA-888 / DSM 13862 / ZAS-9) TaxID=545695 RepID=F5YFQ0_LEAAZ|nr:hypothetical protein [Leadbettera azotonutricia]AEF81322.1 hypothetical protein TREAZ_2470 [Leadbettera azotonutricia ZAS-9]
MGPVKPPVGSDTAPGAAFKAVPANNAGPALASLFDPSSLLSAARDSGASGVSQLIPPNPLSQLASGLGLPQDNLTFTLLTFARAFSLPFESIIDIRKEVLAFAPSSPKTGREKAKAEAFSLASTAAAAKGFKLSQGALAELAAAMGDYSGESSGEKDHSGEPFGQPPNPGELREAFAEFSESRSLLGLMDRVHKKNGSNWVVWPFKVSIGSTELKVFVRILIEEPFSDSGSGLLMADITGLRRHWRFFLERSHEGKFRARIGLVPGQEPEGLKTLETEAAKALGSFLGADADVRILNGEVMLADFMGCEALPSINEEV